MSVTHQLLVALPAEAHAILEHDEPSRDWSGFACDGLDSIKLVALWAAVETGSTESGFEQRMDSIKTLSEGQDGPWVDVAPPSMVLALASLAGLEDDELSPLADALLAMEDFEGWDEDEVVELMRSIGDQAETAKLEGKSLVLYTTL